MMENRQRDRAKLTKRGEIERTIYVYIYKHFLLKHTMTETPRPLWSPAPSSFFAQHARVTARFSSLVISGGSSNHVLAQA